MPKSCLHLGDQNLVGSYGFWKVVFYKFHKPYNNRPNCNVLHKGVLVNFGVISQNQEVPKNDNHELILNKYAFDIHICNFQKKYLLETIFNLKTKMQLTVTRHFTTNY